MRHRFQTEQWLPYPKEQLFAFFADSANLPPLMPAWQQARVETVARPLGAGGRVAAGEGSVIT